jgi:hypothetical protein
MKDLENDKHYFELGKTHGRSEFKTINFIEGLIIGFGIGIMLMEILI